MWSATKEVYPFVSAQGQLPVDLSETVNWIASKTASERERYRESVVSKIEQLAAAMVADGRREAWFSEADAAVASVCRDVNGPIAEWLANASGFCDIGAIEQLRTGGDIVGVLHQTGLGSPIIPSVPADVAELRNECFERNKKLLKTLHEDDHALELLNLIRRDAELGRMTFPRLLSEVDLRNVLLMRRFGVVQGLRSDGTTKVRAVDDASGSGGNACCSPSEKLQNDRYDKLANLIQEFFSVTSMVPALWKCDVDAAFRRVPARPDHRWLIWVAVLCEGQVFAAQHNALPFGCVASVHGWNRLGAFLAHVALKVLRLPILRYVDDFVGIESRESVAHAMDCFVRVVRCILGATSLSDDKMGVGITMEYLGVCVHPSIDGISFWPSASKIARWKHDIEQALISGVFSAGDASKLVGRLAFANQVIFKRVGRAMLRPLYAQQHKPLKNGRVGKLLELSLKWWHAVLSMELRETIPLKRCLCEVVELFGDARGYPPRVASVLVRDNVVQYSDWQPDEQTMNAFCPRRDQQIMGQELLAVVFGMSTFLDELRGCCVRVWIDNAAGEAALEKGAAASSDHNALIHGIWLLAARHGFTIWVERVASEFNIADEPSREVYTGMAACGARWKEPILRSEFWNPSGWLQLLPLQTKTAVTGSVF